MASPPKGQYLNSDQVHRKRGSRKELSFPDQTHARSRRTLTVSLSSFCDEPAILMLGVSVLGSLSRHYDFFDPRTFPSLQVRCVYYATGFVGKERGISHHKTSWSED